MMLEGKLLGNRYEIIEKIGNGGMATVYKAVDKILKRNVAVKILRDEVTTDEEFIKRFEAEAQSAASITHPNIVSVYDVGVDGNLYYIVMELVQGKTLKEIIVEEEGPLPWKWSVNIAIQVASALEVAHKNNIVHRDIKPHNIIITEDGVAKVTDFGIAKAVSNSTITAFGTTIGSVHYFSPEHARGGYTDAKSDLYSLGVVMYEMLTGKVPFDADTPVSIALKHMQEEPVPPIEINRHIPLAVNDIIMKALKKDANYRYASATEMLKDLRKSLKDPDGDFIKVPEGGDEFKTQRISTNYQEKQDRGEEKKGLKSFIAKHKVLSSVIGLILLFAISLGGTMGFLNLTNPKEVKLPNLVGLSKQEAENTLKENKLTLEIKSEEYNSQYAEGYIISQDPSYVDNYNVKEKSVIKVVVSKGTESTIVPKVVGLTKDEAIRTLEDAKLKAEVKEETSKDVEEGYVIAQDINKDEQVNAGDTITITVSTGTGINQVTVDSVVGKSEDDAKKTLTNTGLKVTVSYTEDSTKNNGEVVKQSIDAGSVVDEGTSITITVNKLAETKTGKVVVNVKSLLKGKVEYEKTNTTDENSTTTDKVVKKVELKIVVGDDTVYKEKVDPTTTKVSQEISGKGTVDIKVYIDDVLKKSGTLNLNSSTKWTAE